MISGSSLVEGDEKQDRQDTSKYRFLPKKAIFLTQDRQRLLKSIGLASAGQYLWQKSAASTTVKQNLDIVHREVSTLLWYFMNETAYHLSQYEPPFIFTQGLY